MNELHNSLSDKQVDHLILLVGGNPLPNAVAGRILLKPGGTIGLLYSPGTIEIKNRLKEWFGLPASQIAEKQIDESNPTSIYQGTRDLLQTARPGATIGLNYTGGTKAMSVHAYQATKIWASEKKFQPSFTYLDARTLSMVYETDQRMPYVGLALDLPLDKLFALHNWRLSKPPQTKPFLPKICNALLPIYADKEELFPLWDSWKREELQKKCGKLDQNGKWNRKWQSKTKLKETLLDWPTQLPELINALQEELQQMASPHLSVKIATENGNWSEPGDFCDWLNGGYWLESVVLEKLHEIGKECNLHDIAMNLTPFSGLATPTKFELDVVALHGYQLFAFSCGTDTDQEGGRERLKLKLFEAFVRSQQLGGEEARVALVCCADDPDGLNAEMQRTLSSKQIKVLGRKSLANLKKELTDWIREESRER